MFLQEAAALLTAPPGSLVYHLVMAVTLGLLFSFARALRERVEAPLTIRWSLAAGGLLALRLVQMVAAGLAWLALIDGQLILPPLDRFASFLTPLVLSWSLLAPEPSPRKDRLFMAAVSGAILGLLASFLLRLAVGAGAPFNGTLSDLTWSGAILLLGLSLGLALVLTRPPQWELSFGPLLLIAAGAGAHLAFGGPGGSLAGFLRLAELTAYPLIALAGARALAWSVIPLPAKSTGPLTASTHAGVLREGLSRLTELLVIEDSEQLARSAVKALAHHMRAEYCLLLTPPEPEDQFAIATAYDLIREQHLPGAALDSKGCPVIASALNRRRTLAFPAESQSPDMQVLRKVLGLDATGPALLAPVAGEGRLHGGVLLLSPYARQHWEPDDRKALEAAAAHLGARFSRLMEPASQSSEELQDLQQALAEAQQRIAALEEENARLQQEYETGQAEDGRAQADNLAALLSMNEEAQETIRRLQDELETLRAAQQSSPPEMEQLAGELQLALAELADARARLSALEEQGAWPTAGSASAAQGPDVEAIASIAQELRQPMSSILGYTDLLLGESVGLLGAMQRKFLERVRSGIERMGALLNDLIQVTAIETGTLSLTPGPVDLVHCVEEAVMQTSVLMRDRGIALRMDIPDDMPPVLGDEDAAIQILVHLLQNAIGASPEGGEVILATRLENTDQGDFAMLSVSDAGEGIPSEDLGRVFKRIYRADNTLVQGLGDRGVGLSIVKALSEAMGGRVWVDSEVGTGTTFTVLMPLAPSQVAESGDVYQVP